ncbi:MAG: shikimate kinase [Methanoculleus sp.]|nr:shikimate kinase [Methanoculleus sp.]
MGVAGVTRAGALFTKQPSYLPKPHLDLNRGFRESSMHHRKNIILIGMPGAGKSTVGVVLAKTLGMQFIDTDILIQERAGKMLQEILDKDGPDAFKRIEEEAILSLHPDRAVVATGGSVVCSPDAMAHLKSGGVAVYLEISYEEMEKRLKNITTRGIVLLPGQSLRGMYDERAPLYARYADLTVACSGGDLESVVRRVIEAL